ncbi:MAG: hypothetical protein ACM3SO_18000 [Betaproteobacteria bacterium]
MTLPRLLLFAALALPSQAALAFFINTTITMSEWVNELTGHYVLLDAFESSQVAAGSAGPGWERTGHQFTESDAATNFAPPGTFKLVCRFYSPANNSHFFTANPDECESLKNPESGWVFEKNAFFVTSIGPQCPGGLVPIYRVYNNRHALHDANHRFTPDATTRDEMIAAGWIDEGVAWCALSGFIRPQKSYFMSGIVIGDAAQCESRTGPCMRLDQLPEMPNFVASFLPPSFVNLNPEYPGDAGSITGAGNVDVRTAQPPGDAAAITSHSFVQMYATSGLPFGVHVTSIDRVGGGPYASIGPMYELPGAAPAPGGIDERLFPYRGVRHHTLVATFDLKVPTLTRGDASSHAYGGLLLQFADVKSGRSFYATVQAYGTVPPGDFVAADATTGRAIVSTVFRADPAFGARLAGDFVPCDAQSACIASFSRYQFRMGSADFANAVERARTIDPALSTDPADYFVAQFRVHNEIFGQAELGAALGSVVLDVYY